MHREEDFETLLQKIAVLEEKLNATESRMQNLQSIMLSNLSHDIRTPMNAIVGFANLLSNDVMESNERNECIAGINTCSIELLDIIDNMVDASLLQTGKLSLLEKKCYLNELIDNLLLTYRELPLVKNKNLKIIAVKAEDKGFSMVTDPDRLKQVFKNLISNSIKFTNTGTIEFGYHKYHNNKIRFYVKDSGIGLGSLNQENMFKPFHSRLCDENEHTGNKGAGLGLSVSKNLIDLMGGEIWPESRCPEGTCFYFTLPAGKSSVMDKKYDRIRDIAKRNIASFF